MSVNASQRAVASLPSVRKYALSADGRTSLARQMFGLCLVWFIYLFSNQLLKNSDIHRTSRDKGSQFGSSKSFALGCNLIY